MHGAKVKVYFNFLIAFVVWHFTENSYGSQDASYEQNCILPWWWRQWFPPKYNAGHTAPYLTTQQSSWHWIIFPVSLWKGSVILERCEVMLETFMWNEYPPPRSGVLTFQQDAATAHTAHIPMQVLRAILASTLVYRIGNITWPSHSPDHAVPEYFL